MRRIVLLLGVAIIACGMLLVGCDSSSEADGTSTVALTNASAADGDSFVVYVYPSGETDVNNPGTVLATGNTKIASGAATVTVKVDNGSWQPTGTDWVGTGGTSYDFYIYTNDPNDPYADPTSYANSKMTDPMPVSVTVDGNQTLSVDYAAMVPYSF